MKSVRMKGKTVEEAKQMALQVLGVEEGAATIKIIDEGKPAMLGVIGGEEAEVEVLALGNPEDEAKDVLQGILDRMHFLAITEVKNASDEGIELNIKGEDIGRIIGKEGATLKSLGTLVGSISSKLFGRLVRVSVDSGGYREKRVAALERMAKDIADEVVEAGLEKILPPMEASDRRIIHLSLQNHPKVTTFSEGDGKSRRLIVSPKK